MSLSLLEAPTLTVAKGEAIMQVSPPSLRFWEKLGLSPKAGPKDVTAFVFFEGADEDREADIESWLSRVSAAYAVGFTSYPSCLCPDSSLGQRLRRARGGNLEPLHQTWSCAYALRDATQDTQ